MSDNIVRGSISECQDSDPDAVRVGQLRNGWLRMAADFTRAWAWRTGGYRTRVSWHVIEQTWGVAWWARYDGTEPPEPEPVHVNAEALADAWGKSSSKIRAALRSLVEDGILTRTNDGRYLPNKHFNQWEWDAADAAIREDAVAGADAMSAARSGSVPPRRRSLSTPNGAAKTTLSTPNGTANGLSTPNGVGKPSLSTPNGAVKSLSAPNGTDSFSAPNGTDKAPLSTPNGTDNGAPIRKEFRILEGKENSPLPPLEPSDQGGEPPEAAVSTPPVARKASVPSSGPNGHPVTAARPTAAQGPETVARVVTLLPATPGGPVGEPPGGYRPPGRLEIARAECVAAGRLAAGDYEPDAEVLARMEAAVLARYPYEVTRFMVSAWFHARIYPTDWIFRAVKKVAARPEAFRGLSWGLVRSFLDEWMRPGDDGNPSGPGPGPEDYLDDELKIIPYSKRTQAQQTRGRPVAKRLGRPAAPSPIETPSHLIPTADDLAHMAGMRRNTPGEQPPVSVSEMVRRHANSPEGGRNGAAD